MNESPKQMSVKDLVIHVQDVEHANRVIGDELTYFKELCADLEDQVSDLQGKLAWEKRQVSALKLRCGELTKKNMGLEGEIADMKFTRKYLTSEDAGKAFARELLGKPMTSEEIAIDKAENTYVPYNGDDF